MNNSTKTVLDYYRTNESKWGYMFLLQGIRHFGYYPPGKEKIPMKEAQKLMIDHLAKKLNLPRGSYVLDAGCGESWTALYLAEKYEYHILGIDLLQESIDKAKKILPLI